MSLSETVIWHDVECGAYDADLPLWRELAGAARGPILELGCGTGRVALQLARCGHSVTAVDSDPELTAELEKRAQARELEVTVLRRDMRRLDLESRFGLVLAPMQVMQLLDGPPSRRAALESCAASLSPGGTVAISIVEGVPEGGGELAQPLPDVAEVEGRVYSSLPLEIAPDGGTMRVRRLRQVVSPAGELAERVDETRLAVLDAETLEAEARGAGLYPAGRHEIRSTPDHVGSVVVQLGVE